MVESNRPSNVSPLRPQLTDAELGEILRAARFLFADGGVRELRILGVPRAGVVAGYFDDAETLAAAAAAWDGKGAIYLTANPCALELLARAQNRLERHMRHTTKDAEILRRVWLYVDLDPVRAPGIGATDSEHSAAIERAYAVRDRLREEGWPDAILTDSGNGSSLLYRVELENDADADALVRGVLAGLSFEFTDAAVKIDVSVSNAARIVRLPGTLNMKGDDTSERPWRRSRILEAPK